MHRIQVARLARQVEQVIFALHQVAQAVLVPHVGDVYPYAVFNARDIEEIAAVFGYQAVHQRQPGAMRSQPMGQGRTNKTQAPADQHLLARKLRRAGWFSHVLISSQK